MTKAEKIKARAVMERNARDLASKYLGTKDYEEAARWCLAAEVHRAVKAVLEGKP